MLDPKRAKSHEHTMQVTMGIEFDLQYILIDIFYVLN